MDKSLSPHVDSPSNSTVRKPSFRSEIKIHFPKPASQSKELVIKKTTTNKELISSGELRIKCLPPDGRNNSFLYTNKAKNSNRHSKHLSDQFPGSLTTPSPDHNHLSKPILKTFPGEYKRSSSLHPASFLYPKRDLKDLESTTSPPDASQDDSCVGKSNSLKRNDNSKSTDHLFDEKNVQRRNESFTSSEKRHSFCAMESENAEEECLEKTKRNKLDSISLKPGSSTLSISKSNWFVKKYVERQESKLTRKSASCRDLGGCDCEGWLWKTHLKSGLKMTKWVLWWCVLEKKELKFFKQKESGTCEGSIYLPGMRVAPAPELDLKKGAFKVFHAGSTFYFRADKREDMVKWMNKMSLATLSNFEVQSSKMIAGFQNDDEVDFVTQRSFSSESEDNLSSNSSCPSLSGENFNRLSRSSDNLQVVRKSPQINHYQLCSKFSSLNKLLKEKEEQLSIIEKFIGNLAITGEDLKKFIDSKSASFLRMSNNNHDLHEHDSKPDLLITLPSTNESEDGSNTEAQNRDSSTTSQTDPT